MARTRLQSEADQNRRMFFGTGLDSRVDTMHPPPPRRRIDEAAILVCLADSSFKKSPTPATSFTRAAPPAAWSSCVATMGCEWKDELVFCSGGAVLDCIEVAGEEITAVRDQVMGLLGEFLRHAYKNELPERAPPVRS